MKFVLEILIQIVNQDYIAFNVEKGISPLQCEIYNSFKHNNLDKIFINKNY